MNIKFDNAELAEILSDFHTITKMRIVIFDDDFNKIAAYPEKSCDFCDMLKKNPSAKLLCKSCDEKACEMCRKSGRLYMYKCHAGLTEVAAPIKMNGIAVGYIMFGQTTDKEQKCANRNTAADYCAFLGIDREKAVRAYDRLLCKSGEQIKAASKIAECCISYLVMNGLVRVDKGNLGYLISEYISANISSKIHADDICCAFGIGRTKLFEVSTANFGMSITRYIRKRKIQAAAEYLSERRCRVSEAADFAGFSDYNYFSKVFKAETGFSPKSFAKKL